MTDPNIELFYKQINELDPDLQLTFENLNITSLALI